MIFVEAGVCGTSAASDLAEMFFDSDMVLPLVDIMIATRMANLPVLARGGES